MKVFLDTNILLDTLVERSNQVFTDNAITLLGLGENGVIDLDMSALSISTIAYVLKNMTSVRKKEIIKDLTSIVKVLPVLPEHVDNMLESPMKDVEEALHVQSAKEGLCDLIVTRNESDFKETDILVICPEELLKKIIG